MPDTGAARLRLFIALPCPLTPSIAAALDELRTAQHDPASGLRIVDGATLHITLSFLGAVAAGQVAEVGIALQQLRELSAPQLHIVGAGHFPSALWLGVRQDPLLMKLAENCAGAMRALGFELEARTFVPHVTVARLKARPGFDCAAWANKHRDARWAEGTARTVHLYRSDGTGDGARYSVLHSVTLGARPPALAF